MKVLNVNKYFYIKGGAETYYFELNNMLEKNGHDVMVFSMKHDNNFDSEYKEFFVDNIDYYTQTKPWQKVANAMKIIYSTEAKKKINMLLNKEMPDVVHLQNFHHQLSTSILDVFKKKNIPVVYTAHDLKLICGNYKMLAGNRICEDCKDGNHINCVKNKCVKDSLANSMVTYLEMSLAERRKVIDKIDFIITPSKFYKNKMIEFGISPNKIEFIPNFIDESNYTPVYEYDNYFVYFGRISEEKGLFTLVDAMKKVEGAQLYIVGSGPLDEEVRKRIEDNNELSSKIKMLGYKTGDELKEILSRAMFNILPSEWYENGPYSVLEMMCMGKPTIGADIGGISDMIKDGKSGYLFESGNSCDLAHKINMLLDNKDDIIRMGKEARAIIEREHTAEIYYERLMDVYNIVTGNQE